MDRIIFVDGGSNHRLSEKNPKWRNIGIGWGCVVDAGNTDLFWIPEKTCNEAELIAMILALRKLEGGGVRGATILSDSKIAVNASDPSRARSIKAAKRSHHLTPLVAEAKSLVGGTKTTIEWIPRDQNKAGIILEGFEAVGEEEIRKRFDKLNFEVRDCGFESLPIFGCS